ncbi:MAG: AAA family ATPase [Acidobacteriota bacterium]
MEPNAPRATRRSLADVMRWPRRGEIARPAAKPAEAEAEASAPASQPLRSTAATPAPPQPATQPLRSTAATPAQPPPQFTEHDIWRHHYRLQSEPFALTPDPEFLFPSDAHTEAMAGLKLGLWERRGLLVIVGEVGTGKTTLVYSLLSELDPQIETAYLSNTLLTFEELLQSALMDFGVEAPSRNRLDLQNALNGFLRECAQRGKTAALVIDEAQNLTDEVFEQLRLLLNFETYKTKLLQILLSGQPELADKLQQPNLRQIGNRVAVRCRLGPLSSREARAYIEHRLNTAGGSLDLFTRAALGLLVRKARGIPRRINILAHNALLFAYGRELERVDRATMAQAVREMKGSIAAP